MSRISRGFHRLAIVVAAPIVMAAVWMAGAATLERNADVASDSIRASLAADARAAAKAKLPPGFVLTDEISPKPNNFDKFGKEPSAKDPAGTPTAGPWTEYKPLDHDPFAAGEARTKTLLQYFAMSLLTLAFATFMYLAIRSLGWIIQGFMRDPEGAN